MNVIVGYLVIVGCCLGGFALAGGHLIVLFQPIEVLIIGGCLVGATVAGNSSAVLKSMGAALGACFKPPHLNKDGFMSLMACLFEILSKVRKEGLMSIEQDVENPESSAIFSKYPEILHDHHLVEFITDYLRLMVSGNLNPMEIENLMDSEIDTHHAETHAAQGALSKMADGAPAFGIVAAVMGVVHVMGSVGQVSNAELGNMIAAALVGTFLGILMAYGFMAPLANIYEQKAAEDSKAFDVAKTVLLASLNGYSPAVAVEFGRKVLFSPVRPTFKELEEHVKNAKGK